MIYDDENSYEWLSTQFEYFDYSSRQWGSLAKVFEMQYDDAKRGKYIYFNVFKYLSSNHNFSCLQDLRRIMQLLERKVVINILRLELIGIGILYTSKLLI